MARTRRDRPHRTWPQRLLLGVNVVLVIACVGSAAALSQIRSTVEDIPVVDFGSSLTPAPELSEPRNFLIIGTDSAARLDDDDPVTDGREMMGQLADVIMILRVDPRDGTAMLLSIPRDSRVAVAPDGNMGRINTAIGAGGDEGPRNLVQTIKRNFGISIDNFVEIDFKSFRDLVEVLGGVPVYFTTPVRDRQSGLFVDEPGCIMLSPDQALAYARSRSFEYRTEDGWQTDGTGDLGRITRQQDFIKRALRRASDKGIRNPTTAVGVVNAATASVRMDDSLDVGTILTLVGEFQSFNPDALASNQVPTFSDPRGGVAYQSISWDQAEALLEPFRGVDPTVPLTPRNVIVDVMGTRADEEALQGIAGQLDDAGFDAEPSFTRSSNQRTTITFGPRGRDAALLLASQLEVLPEIEYDEDIAGYRVELGVGSDFGGVRAEAVPLEQLPPDLAPQTTSTTAFEAPVDPGDGGEVLPDSPDPVVDPQFPTTETTEPPPGVVPTDPDRAATCR